MTSRLTVLLVATIALVAISAGCGGNNGSDTNVDADSGSEAQVDSDSAAPRVTVSSLTREQYIVRANRACAELREELLEQLSVHTERQSPEGQSDADLLAAVVNDVLLPNVELEVSALRELGAPAGDRGRVEAILLAQQEALDRVAELESIDTMQQVEAQFREAGELMRDYGIDSCDRGPAPESG